MLQASCAAVGEFRIVSQLGEGGMGVVYRARHPRLGREVALTLLPPEVEEPEAVIRFQREVRLAARLSHPNLVRIFDGGHSGSQPFIAMELIDGENLHQSLRRRGAFQWPAVMAIASRIASAGHAKPPQFGNVSQAPLSALEKAVVRYYTPADSPVDETGRIKAKRVPIIIRGVGGTPGDPVCWLNLGRLLETDGQPREAGIAYSWALKLLKEPPLDGISETVWSGLARALLLFRPERFENEWMRWVKAENHCELAWRGLRAAIRSSHPALYERLLQRRQAQVTAAR